MVGVPYLFLIVNKAYLFHGTLSATVVILRECYLPVKDKNTYRFVRKLWHYISIRVFNNIDKIKNNNITKNTKIILHTYSYVVNMKL